MILIYTKSTCPYCDRAKEVLKGANLPYKEIAVGHEITSEEYRQLFPGHTTVPGIVVDGIFIGGYSQLEQYLIDKFSS